MNERQRRRWMSRAFQARGLVIQARAVDGIWNVLRREDVESERQVKLEAIVEEVWKRRSSKLIVSEELLEEVIADMTTTTTTTSSDDYNGLLQLLQVFDMPQLMYDVGNQQFSLEKAPSSLLGQPTDKIDRLLHRYQLIHQRLLKQELFRPTSVTTTTASKKPHVLTSVESLLGQSSSSSSSSLLLLLGMLVEEEGYYSLEDTTARVRLDFTEAMWISDGYLTPQSIVLVEGDWREDEGILYVMKCGHPMVEARYDTLSHLSLRNADIYNAIPTVSALDHYRQLEVSSSDKPPVFCVLSHVYLDKPDVMQKLQELFSGFQHQVATSTLVFVFMGNFMANHNDDNPVPYWEDLATLIRSFPSLAQQARFLFVPGPNDPGLRSVLPQPPLPSHLLKPLLSKDDIPHVISTTNPCRIRYASKDLLLFRQDTIHPTMSQHIPIPSQQQDETSTKTEVQHVVKTILDQSHLCPFAQNIYWPFDYTLRLYPLPDAILLGDSYSPFYENYAECDVVNPGPFSNHPFPFVVYRPVVVTTSTTDNNNDHETTHIQSDVEFSQID